MEKKQKKSEKKKIKKKIKEDLPFCRKAPSAEHARGHDNDEPCDDGRTGDLEKKTSGSGS